MALRNILQAGNAHVCREISLANTRHYSRFRTTANIAVYIRATPFGKDLSLSRSNFRAVKSTAGLRYAHTLQTH